MTARILVAYASYTGSTAGVAEAIGKQLAAGDMTVDVRRVEDATDLNGYSGVVVGSAIHSGRWLPGAVGFVQSHRDRLRQLPTAYFLVCLMAANDTEENRRVVATFLEPVRTLVEPVAEGRFAGYLWYDKYSFVEGLGMRIFARTQKLSEGDYRDWDAIRAWADSIRPLLLR